MKEPFVQWKGSMMLKSAWNGSCDHLYSPVVTNMWNGFSNRKTCAMCIWNGYRL